MKSVVLSTTEAEYTALSEVVKELKFIVQLLQTMNITVDLLKIPVLFLSRSPALRGSSTLLGCPVFFFLRLLVYMYLSQLMRTSTNYLKCIVLSF